MAWLIKTHFYSNRESKKNKNSEKQENIIVKLPLRGLNYNEDETQDYYIYVPFLTISLVSKFSIIKISITNENYSNRVYLLQDSIINIPNTIIYNTYESNKINTEYSTLLRETPREILNRRVIILISLAMLIDIFLSTSFNRLLKQNLEPS